MRLALITITTMNEGEVINSTITALSRSAEVIAVIAFAPLVLAAISALLLVFIVKLLFSLVAVGFET